MKHIYFLCLFLSLTYSFNARSQQDSLFVRKVGHWPYSTAGGVRYDSTNKVAMVGSGQMMLFFDVADPVHPVKISEIYLSGQNQKLAVSGHYAYMTVHRKGFDIIDISNPRSPVKTGFAKTPGYAFGISVSGNYAYVGDGEKGLRIIDISDRFHPIEKGSYQTTGFATFAPASGNYAYLGDYGAGLRIINVSNPSQPQQIGFFSAPKVWGVALTGKYVLIEEWDGGNIRIIDVSNPSSPTEVSSINWNQPGNATQVVVSGDYAYVCAEWPTDPHVGIRIVDISDPFHPLPLGNISSLLAPDIAVSSGYAFVSDWTDGFHIYDISTPAFPTLLAIYDVPGTYGDVVVSGDLAYIANPSYAHDEPRTGFYDLVGLRIINISNPASLTEVGFSQHHRGTAQGVAASGSLAFVASEYHGLIIFDTVGPSAPKEIGFIETPGNSQRLTIAGTHAFIAAGYSGLRIIDVSNPRLPTETGFYDTPGFASDVAISGNYAYVADGKQGIRIIDIMNLSAPNEIGSYIAPDSAITVAVSGKDLFIGAGGVGGAGCLRRIEVSNPSAPILKATLCFQGSYVNRIAISGSYAYLAGQINGVRIIDISDPSSLIERGYYIPYASVEGIALSGNYIYAAAQDDGMFIFEFLKTPLLQLNTKNVSFGNVKVGQFKDTTVTISNSGTDTLRTPSITSSNTAFSPRPATRLLAPGQSFSDTLRFAPSAAGILSANIILVSNASTSPDTIRVTGTGVTSSEVEKLPGVPTQFTLDQNFPNPFNPSTEIRYALPKRTHVLLSIVNEIGQQVNVLVDQEQEIGYYRTTWKPISISSGVYFYRLQAGEFVETKKLILIR